MKRLKRTKNFTQEQIAEIILLAKDGVPNSKIAEIYKKDVSSIFRILQKNRVDRPKPNFDEKIKKINDIKNEKYSVKFCPCCGCKFKLEE